MKIAFVGVKRRYQELRPDYVSLFNRYHLELPYYYAREGKNNVTITTVDMDAQPGQPGDSWMSSESSLELQRESVFLEDKRDFDVVIHWRKWFPEFYRPEAINLINCQDHSFSPEWKQSVCQAFQEGKLRGILCFPKWHKQNLRDETGIPASNLYDGVTLGVDTDVYKPSELRDPFKMLWASDPGRGLINAIQLTLQLYQQDRRFALNVCYPDYVKGVPVVSHPAIVYHRNLENGPKLWNLFNTSSILPYTSTFKEPSSRAHRQAQAAGSMVLYPPGMGSPSDLIRDDVDGLVRPVHEWPQLIVKKISSGDWVKIGARAREMAISENWSVQSKRFNLLMEKLLKERM